LNTPRVQLESGDARMKFHRQGRVELSIGMVDFDTDNDDWIITKEEKFDIDWRRLYTRQD